MAVAALVLCGVGLATALVVRIGVQVRRTGDMGFRGFGTVGSAGWWVGGLILVASAAVMVAPVAALMGLGAIAGTQRPVVQGAGVALVILGVIAIFAAQLSMGASWRMGVDGSERTELITSGAFRLVRNPIYTAAVVTVGGLVLRGRSAYVREEKSPMWLAAFAVVRTV